MMSGYEIHPLTILWHLAAAALVLILPGLAWLAWFRDPERDASARLGEAAGLSLALTALAGLVFFQAGWRLSAPVVAALYATLAVLALGPVAVRRLAARQNHPSQDAGPPQALQGLWPTSGWLLPAILAGLAALIAWRLYQVRELVLPAWVDPLHHVLIVRLILEGGGLPATFEPTMPVPFSYHFTFHLVTAAFAFWSRLSPVTATLVMGQVLNALVGLSTFHLARALWGGWRRAAIAGLLVGFAAQMPAYYATWGRYTLLAGLTLLPVAMAAGVTIARRGATRERVARLAVLTGGLLLTHYFAALLLGLFLGIQAALSFGGAFREGRSRRMATWGALPGIRRSLALLAAGAIGLALAAPWLARVVRLTRQLAWVQVVTPSQALDQLYFSDYLNYLGFLLGPQRNLVLLALGGLGWLLVGWRPAVRALSLWTLVLALLALPWGPKLNPFRPDHAVIVLFLPASLHLADGMMVARERLRAGRLAWAVDAATGALVVTLLAWGLRDTARIINPVTILARAPDREALDWIAGHTPEQARFLINVTPWQYGFYRGVDGGWWITPLTGRQTLVPPALYFLASPDFIARTNAAASRAAGLTGCTSDLANLLQEDGLDYIYLGTNPGSLQPAALEGCPFLKTVYNQGGVVIYEFLPSGSAGGPLSFVPSL